VRTPLGLVIGASVTTFAAGIAAVWVTGDARAFGVILTLAGVAAGIAAAPPKVRDVIASWYASERQFQEHVRHSVGQ
jgi:hypothetical protein